MARRRTRKLMSSSEGKATGRMENCLVNFFKKIRVKMSPLASLILKCRARDAPGMQITSDYRVSQVLMNLHFKEFLRYFLLIFYAF